MEGKIKALKASFGFIKVENEEKDLFFHQTDVIDGESAFQKLKTDDEVTFEKKVDAKGPKATNVKLK